MLGSEAEGYKTKEIVLRLIRFFCSIPSQRRSQV